MTRDSQDNGNELFDWSFEFHKDGEIFIVDKEFEIGSTSFFYSSIHHLGYVIGNYSVTIFGDTKIFRMDICDLSSGIVVGKAIRLNIDGIDHDAIQVNM